ncbi:DegT/DnrJ/EryC1/StrS family aminotransferase [Candidatus Omnitrophota bacterium]
MSIPYYSMDLNAHEWRAIVKTIFSCAAFDGPFIKAYEERVKSDVGIKHMLPFPSGRTGFHYLIDALFVPGDEIICSVCSFPFFIRLLHEKGIKPVFVDIEEEFCLINPDLIEGKITSKTKGILVTHLFGNPCEMDKITEISKRNNLSLIEDCAHAYGTKYKGKPVGVFGQAAVFSTSPMKVPTTLGGGFVVTDDDALYSSLFKALYSSEGYKFNFKKLFQCFTFSLVYYLNSFPTIFSMLASRVFKKMRLKNPGELRKLFYSELVATKLFDPFERLRFSNLQARVGLSQLERFDQMTQVRRRYAQIYESAFKGCQGISMIKEKPDCFNNYLYDIAVIERDQDQFVDRAIERGLFLMDENCWYCNKYDFSKAYVQKCPVGEEKQYLLIRLPNSSLLSEKAILQTAQIIRELVMEE